MVNISTNINKANNHLSPKESINSDGKRFACPMPGAGFPMSCLFYAQ
jgi:uncharacterized Zn-finger protein